MKKLLIFIIILAGLWLLWNYQGKEESQVTINSFNECVEAGNLVMESYPRQCRGDDKTFIEDIGNELEKTDFIRIDSPRPNATIKSPVQITGQARGNWFFEADFPVKLLDDNGKELAISHATALTEWMTEDFVSFEGVLEFTTPTTSGGVLILEKDNPSGLPEHADELRVPIKF